MRSPAWHWSWTALALGLLAAVWSTLAPYGPIGASSFLAVASLGVVLSAVGARQAPPARRRAWILLALGQLAYLTGDVCWVVYDHVLGIEPSPSPADVFFLSRYALVAAGLLVLLRDRRRDRDRAALLDAGILMTGFGVLATVFLVVPAAASGGSRLVDQVVAGAYPLADVLVLGVFMRLLTSGAAARSTSFWALSAGLGAMFVIDVLYTLNITAGLEYPAWLDGGWLVTYLLLGFAAAHPSAVLVTDPAVDAPERMTRGRIALLGLALVLAPLTNEVAHLAGFSGASHVVLVGAVVGTTLVMVRLWDLLASLERQAVQLNALSRVDALTGVANRRAWDHELGRACDAARDSQRPLTVAVLDLDHFKAYNDTHGHLKGDQVLKETAAAWEEALEGHGVLARFGGEEFTLLLPDHRLADAEPLLERLRGSVAAGQTCSIGVAVWETTEEPAQVVARADLALYDAKRAGRDRVAVHHGTAAGDPSDPRAAGVEQLLLTEVPTV